MKCQKIIIVMMLVFPSWVHGGEAGNQNIISVCYNYSCKNEGQVELTGSEWAEIEKLFLTRSHSSLEERQKISKAIALMERFAGIRLGTSNDRAKNSGTGEPGQMDCIDESKNTTSYINLFIEKGWITWHQVQDRAVRNPYFFNTHWTAVIKDIKSKQLYAIDSWYRDNGKEPVVSTLEDWFEKKVKP